MKAPAARRVAVDMIGVALVRHASASGNVRIQRSLYADLYISRARNVNVTTVGFQIGSKNFARSAKRCFHTLGCTTGPDLSRTGNAKIRTFTNNGQLLYIA